jgi:hypothetical protein
LTLALEKLESALSRMSEDADGTVYLKDGFHGLSAHTSINASMGPREAQARSACRFVFKDLGSLMTIALRLDWQKALWANGELEDVLWIKFVETDIHLFHVEFRSLFDYLSGLVSAAAVKFGQVPTVEFRGQRPQNADEWLAIYSMLRAFIGPQA